MSPSLPVVLNRDHLHDVSVADRITASEPVSIEITNEGEAVHVHLHLDDELSTVASLEAGNHFVEGGTTRSVRLDVRPASTPVTGRLRVVTGYGAETEFVTIRVEPATEEKTPVEVDEDLGRPQPQQTRGNGGGASLSGSMTGSFSDGDLSLPDAATLTVVALAVVAVVMALLVAAFVDSAAVLLGVGVVIGVVVAALFFLVR